ncbi:MAG: hypothetical protein JSR62_17285 [Nitrospira sp.]|nr:hypothetical protein [Nitrospira sp.]
MYSSRDGGTHCCKNTKVVRHLVCQHRIEVELWPAKAEVYFCDEHDVDPVNTYVRFEAAVFNGSTSRVEWTVERAGGGPAAGSIDSTGLYVAPPKGLLPYSLTDMVVATSAEDPLRKAVAFVTVIGHGPAPLPPAQIEIAPKQIYLYYPEGQDNAYMDLSNTMQMFRAFPRHSDSLAVEWLVDGMVQAGAGPDPWFLYRLIGTGSIKTTTVTARLKNHPLVEDAAKVIQLNYSWPGLV